MWCSALVREVRDCGRALSWLHSFLPLWFAGLLPSGGSAPLFCLSPLEWNTIGLLTKLLTFTQFQIAVFVQKAFKNKPWQGRERAGKSHAVGDWEFHVLHDSWGGLYKSLFADIRGESIYSRVIASRKTAAHTVECCLCLSDQHYNLCVLRPDSKS